MNNPGDTISIRGTAYTIVGVASDAVSREEYYVLRSLSDQSLLVCKASDIDTLIDKPAPLPTATTSLFSAGKTAQISKHSPTDEKLNLFMETFGWRRDVYARRFEGKDGGNGYAPVCRNEWGERCPRTRGERIKCAKCDARELSPLTVEAMEKHLLGKLTIGVYAISSDETCRFLAMDFDDADYRADAVAVAEVCAEYGISCALERSRSGEVAHLWVFFSEDVPCSTARRLGDRILHLAAERRHKLSLASYDRMLPNQDTLPKGGFGNLIALPLQKLPRAQGNSVFVNERFEPFADQWEFLSSRRAYSEREIEAFLELMPKAEPAFFAVPSEPEPWKHKKVSAPTRMNFSDTVRVIAANMLYIEKKSLSEAAMSYFIRMASFKNPDFYKAQAMHMSTWNKPCVIVCAEDNGDYLCLPRGLLDDIIALLDSIGVEYATTDETNHGRAIQAEFTGQLRPEQSDALNALSSHENGVLSATTAFGKTVVAAALIGQMKVNTLIIVHRTQLLDQWHERLSEFLRIDEKLPEREKKRGRQRAESIIGRIGGGRDERRGIIDVAVTQSLLEKPGGVKDFVREYGMVIVDECHHVSASSFERVLKAASARFVYGLTATPTRQDGHQPIIFMQCGAIRYTADAKAAAEMRPFSHMVTPCFTSFRVFDNNEKTPTITELYRLLVGDAVRNGQIVSDVRDAVAQGRTPLVLTERKDHITLLSELLSAHADNIIVLVGGNTRKYSREALERLAAVPDGESLIVIATGKYVGEGFDCPRLDTLFLTMPVSWKGTVQQYAGRLHRIFNGKDEVRIYDFIDVRVPMLERMYHKRQRAYSAMGYSVSGDDSAAHIVNSIFDVKSFPPVFLNDIHSARKTVTLVSPYMTMARVNMLLRECSGNPADVTVVTRCESDFSDKSLTVFRQCVEALMGGGVKVVQKSRIHQKYAVIDEQIVWYGSVNLLSFGHSQESVMRIVSSSVAAELLELV